MRLVRLVRTFTPEFPLRKEVEGGLVRLVRLVRNFILEFSRQDAADKPWPLSHPSRFSRRLASPHATHQRAIPLPCQIG